MSKKFEQLKAKVTEDLLPLSDAIELLQQRIHQTNFKEFLSGREDEGLPPGISSMREFRVTVRKPSNK